MQKINGKYLPKGFQEKSKLNPPIPESIAAKPLPAVGFNRKGFSFGSSYASPTGSA